jgi:hypothetical protein
LIGLETGFPVKLRRALADIYIDWSRYYEAQLQTYLRDPAHHKLAAYIVWLLARRDAAVATFMEGCGAYPRMSSWCAELVTELGARSTPWPQDLNDDLLITEYLAERQQRDERPFPAHEGPSPDAD